MPCVFTPGAALRRHAAALAGALAFAASAASAASLSVAPVRVVLTPARPVAAITLANDGDSEIAVQAQVLAWSQENGQDVYDATRDVLVNPAIFRVGPQGQQIVRIGLQVPPQAHERSYRIFLQQLPRDASAAAGEQGGARLQTLLRLGVPIFVPPAGAAHQELQWRLEAVAAGASPSGPRYRLRVDNGGSEHVQFTHAVVRLQGGAEVARKSLSQYVLAGESSTFALDLPPLAPDASLQIEVQADTPSPVPPALVRVPRAEPANH